MPHRISAVALGWIGLLCLVATACGPSTLWEYVSDKELPYASTCRDLAAGHAKRVDDLKYNPPRLTVYRWTKPLPGGKHAVLDEVDFVDGLVTGEARFVLVRARGGVGKSTLAKAIEAQACGKLPTFRLDLAADVAAQIAENKSSGNLVLGALEHKLHIDQDESARDSFRAMMKKGSFLLLLDSLDEVPLAIRAKVVEHVVGIRDSYKKNAQLVVFARPAVFSEHYGLKGMDALVELPELTCGRTKATMDWTTEDDAEKARLKAFIATYKLDQQNRKHGQCHLPYMSTYRDIQVVQRLARKFNPKTELGGLQSNLATVHERIVGERLKKELAQMNWDQTAALSAVDKMVRVHGRDDGDWNLEFTRERCLESQAKDPKKPTAAEKYACERILQSALFSRVPGVKEWMFSHRHVADLFLARWLDREVKRMGNCDVVDKHASWIASKRVAGYLMGQPNGRNCLFNVSKALCAKHGFDRNDVALYYRGLPVGKARGPLVKTALAAAEKAAHRCAHRAISAL